MLVFKKQANNQHNSRKNQHKSTQNQHKSAKNIGFLLDQALRITPYSPPLLFVLTKKKFFSSIMLIINITVFILLKNQHKTSTSLSVL